MREQDPYHDEMKLMHETGPEHAGHHINDDTKCTYCGKPLKDWKAGEECPERKIKNT